MQELGQKMMDDNAWGRGAKRKIKCVCVCGGLAWLIEISSKYTKKRNNHHSKMSCSYIHNSLLSFLLWPEQNFVFSCNVQTFFCVFVQERKSKLSSITGTPGPFPWLLNCYNYLIVLL